MRRVEDRTESGLFQTAAVSAATPAVHRNRTQDGLEQKQYEPAGLPRCVLLKKNLGGRPHPGRSVFNSLTSELSEAVRAPSTQDPGVAKPHPTSTAMILGELST